MVVQRPQYDLRPGLSAGSDAWDNGPGGWLLTIDYFPEESSASGVYEPWAGSLGDPLPSARWDGPNTTTEGTIEQTGDGFLRLLGGPNGGSDPDSGTPIRSKDAFIGEVTYQIRWESTAGDDVSLQTSFAVQDTGTAGLNTYDAYPINGYYLIFFAATSTFGLYRRIAGVGNSLTAGATVSSAGLTAIAPGVVWNVAVHCDGVNVSAWVWDDGDARPGSPTFTAADTTYSAGKIRFTVPPSIGGGGEVHIGAIYASTDPSLSVPHISSSEILYAPSVSGGGGGGGSGPPTLVGTATTRNIYSGGPGWPIAAPTGLASGHTVFVGIYSDGSAATSRGWASSGFTQIFEVQSDTSQVWLTILQATISGTPPANFTFTPTAGIPGFWQANCVAFADMDPATVVVGTPFESSSPGAGPVNVPGITVADDDSIVLLYTLNRYGNAPPTGWTSLSSDDLDLYSNPYDAGSTGNVPIANTQSAQPTIGVLISLPPAGGGAGPQDLVVPHLASTAVLYAPTATSGAVSVVVPHLASTATLYAPTVTRGAVTVVVPHIASGAALYAPTVTPGAATVTVPHIASGAVLYAPSLGAVIYAPHLGSTSVLYAPTVTTGAVSVTVPHIASTATLFAPTATRGAVSVTVPHLASTSALFTPTVTTGAVAVTAPHLGSTATLYAPTVTRGAVSVTVPHLASTAVLYSPTFTTGSVSVTVPHLASTATLFAPSLVAGGALGVPHLASTAALHPPTVTSGSVAIAVPHIAATSTTFAPSVTRGAVSVIAPHIPSTALLYSPMVVGAGALVVPHISSSASLFPPGLTLNLTVPHIGSAELLFPPEVSLTFTLPYLDNTNTLWPPSVKHDVAGSTTFLPDGSRVQVTNHEGVRIVRTNYSGVVLG